MTSLPLAFAALLAFGPQTAQAGEAGLMHCFAFTVIEEASDSDWKEFLKATDELPGKIDGLDKVWVGKLRRPLRVYGRGQSEPMQRQWGVCMSMTDEEALAVYAKHAAHAAWVQAYEKVRRPGTTTFDILGQ